MGSDTLKKLLKAASSNPLAAAVVVIVAVAFLAVVIVGMSNMAKRKDAADGAKTIPVLTPPEDPGMAGGKGYEGAFQEKVAPPSGDEEIVDPLPPEVIDSAVRSFVSAFYSFDKSRVESFYADLAKVCTPELLAKIESGDVSPVKGAWVKDEAKYAAEAGVFVRNAKIKKIDVTYNNRKRADVDVVVVYETDAAEYDTSYFPEGYVQHEAELFMVVEDGKVSLCSIKSRKVLN